MEGYFELKQGVRSFSLKIGELGRNDSSKFYAKLNLFGYKGDKLKAWNEYRDLSTAYNKKPKKKK